MPGRGSLGEECLGGIACHVDDAGGSGTGAGKGTAGATGAVTNSGCMPLGGGRCCGRMGGAGNTPVVGTTPKCLGPAKGRMMLGGLLGCGPQGEGDGDPAGTADGGRRMLSFPRDFFG